MFTSVVFQYNYNAAAHVVVNQGGTSSGKTYSILQVLFCLACAEANQIITVAGQDIPKLKVGAVRDALTIQKDPALAQMVKSYNRTDRIVNFTNGSLIEFKSYVDGQSAKSGKRDYLFVNEANGLTYEVYQELALRTKKRIFIDYNPNAAFWVHQRLLGKPGVQLIISDHRHNPFCDTQMRHRIEQLKHENIELWKVYARGMTGKVAGLVLSNWHVCDSIPAGAKLLACGLDFGFTNDHTGCLEVFTQDGELWVNELFYARGLTNPDIGKEMEGAGVGKNTLIIGDSAEPKSIEELWRMGWNVIPANKGAGTVNHSIDILKRYRINITRRSVNLISELGSYKWQTGTDGKTINQPAKSADHLVDPLRYVALNCLRAKNAKSGKTRLPWKQPNFGIRDYDAELLI